MLCPGYQQSSQETGRRYPGEIFSQRDDQMQLRQLQLL